MTEQTSKEYNSGKAYLNEADIFEAYDNKYEITLFKFKLILKIFFITLMREIIYEGKIFRLPFKLGSLGVLKKYGDSSQLDFNLYKQGIKTFIKNPHTHNYRVKFVWSTK